MLSIQYNDEISKITDLLEKIAADKAPNFIT